MLNAKQKRTEKIKDELRRMTLEEGNKTCAVCGMRGPLYVVLDFQTFVCSTCSAIHRSMQHKVKGISMSEFTDDEVMGLRVGGNKRAALIWKVGYHGSPPQGDEYRVRECIRQCFTERSYFDRDAYAQLQDDIANATLPPLKVLTSLDAIGAAPNGTAPRQTTTAPTASTVHVAPAPAVDAFDSLEFFSSPQGQPPATGTAAPQACAHAVQPKDAFDDFFASRSNQHASAPAVPPSLSTAPVAPPPARQQNAFRDDLFGPPATAPTVVSQPVGRQDDFFGPASSAPMVATQPAPRHQQDDFFGPCSSAPTVVSHLTARQPQAPAHDDFFGPSSSAAASRGTTDFFSSQSHGFGVPTSGGNAMHQNMFQQTVWEQRPAEVDGYHMPPVSAAPAPPAPAAAMSNAFADLDPFGGKGLKR